MLFNRRELVCLLRFKRPIKILIAFFMPCVELSLSIVYIWAGYHWEDCQV